MLREMRSERGKVVTFAFGVQLSRVEWEEAKLAAVLFFGVNAALVLGVLLFLGGGR